MAKSQISLAVFTVLLCTSALAKIEPDEAQALCKRQVEMTGKEIAGCETQVLEASSTYYCTPSSVETEPPLSMLFECFAREKREAAARKRQQQEASAAATARAALPSPRIGMSGQQVINGTNWGRPRSINRTTTAGGVREQWVYGDRRYLYFDNGALTAIQD